MRLLPVLYTLLATAFADDVPSQFDDGQLTGNGFGIPGINATYDYVIVGGGTAGALAAARLIEYSNATVALIEAGGFYELSNGNISQLPFRINDWKGSSGQDSWQPLVDWGYFTEPQNNGKIINYAQGRTFGGSSARNLMMLNRPTKGAYQHWADKVGDQAYTWDNMLEFNKRTIKFSDNTHRRPANATPLDDASAFSETGGPLHVTYPSYVFPVSWDAIKAFEAVGFEKIPSFTSGILQGWGWWQFSINPETGLRDSSESSFLQHSLGRPGLTTYINSMVRKILFSGTRAVGVTVDNYGQQPFNLTARKEVIVAAGLWSTPQLLMVSGIGPKETLEKFDIPVISNLQGVGQGIHDSAAVHGPMWEIEGISMGGWKEPDKLQEAVVEFNKYKTGPLTNGGVDVGAFEKIPTANLSAKAQADLAQYPDDWPEVEFIMQMASPPAGATGKNYASMTIRMVGTISRGNMTIASASNLDAPVINPNWLLADTDKEVALYALRRARELWTHIPSRIGVEFYPGANITSDEHLLDLTYDNLDPTHHGTASCSMGKADDPLAVVDSKGRVFGVQNLRIIDSSTMPLTPPGHTMGPTYANAEKLVQDIVDHYKDLFLMAESEKRAPSPNGFPLDTFQQDQNSAEQASSTTDQDDAARAKDDRKRLHVLCGSALIQLPLWGFVLSYGIFEEYWTSNWTLHGDLDITGVIGTTSNGIIYISMPFLFAIFTRYWARYRFRAELCGLALAFLGFILSSFSTHVWHLMVTQGILAAFGCTLVYSPATCSLGEWYASGNRAVAYGIILSCRNIVGSTCPFLLRYLLDQYGFRWTIRIWAFILAGSGLISIFLVPTHPSKMTPSGEKPPRIPWTFLKHRGIYVFCIAITLQSAGYCLPQTYLPSFARDFSDASQAISTLLLTLHNIPGIFSCFFFGWLTDNKYHQFSAATTTCLSAFAASASVFLLWGFTTQGSSVVVLVFAIFFGFFAGGYSATWGGITKELEHEAEKHNETIDSSLTYGLLNGARGIGFVSGGLVSIPLLNSGDTGWGGRFGYGTKYGPLMVFTGIAVAFGGLGLLRTFKLPHRQASASS
ncbi:Versicolorin B synthase [Neonectria ditissima]|uniref:Versicolorin B synthase n=1 Tax=Neonectria ditissima TaxID=78410 RepID=A0A0P7AUD8_9HYPO|nr:Versicolorin B synthase [Neonectria ditissima]